jgi:hypothetical protein
MSQKLIMENWRRFLSENKEQQVLDEGILDIALAAIMAFSNAGGDGVIVNGDLITPEEAKQAVEILKTGDDFNQELRQAGIEDIGDIFEKATEQLDKETISVYNLDGVTVVGGLSAQDDFASPYDGSPDDITRNFQLGEYVASFALDQANEAGTYGADTGDTGAPDRIPGSSASSVTNYDKVLKVLSTSVSMGGSPERLNDLKAQAERYLDQAPDDKQQGFKDIIATIDSKLN